MQQLLQGEQGVFVAASDYMKALPLSIAQWVPAPYTVLGTDGYGLSESREDLRRHFEVNAGHIAYAAIALLATQGLHHKAGSQGPGGPLEDCRLETGRLAAGPDRVSPGLTRAPTSGRSRRRRPKEKTPPGGGVSAWLIQEN